MRVKGEGDMDEKYRVRIEALREIKASSSGEAARRRSRSCTGAAG
jgi:hypothetical protein